MSSSTSHRAAILTAAGAKLEVLRRTTPSLAADEILVKITATAINPVDWKLRGFLSDFLEFPTPLGSDAAGEVVKVSEGVRHLAVGDRVFFQGILNKPDATTFQEYCKVPASLVGKTPHSLTDEQVAGVSLACIAATTAFYHKSGHGIQPPWTKGGTEVGRGKAMIILGGSSSVGQYAVQLAKISGYDCVITNSSSAHVDDIRSLGANIVLDRSTASVADYKIAVGGLDSILVFDAISIDETQELGVEILQSLSGGDLVTLLPTSVEPVPIKYPDPSRPVTIKRVMGIGSLPELRYLSEPLMKSLGGEDGWLATGLFKPNNIEVVPGGLAAIETALAKSKKGVSGVKLIVRPFEDC